MQNDSQTIKLRLREKRSQLEDIIRNDIIGRRLLPGERLPSYDAMAEQYGVSKATQHFVVQQLKSDGFLHGVERQGIFVASQLPHLSHVGLAFDADEHENVFLSTLARECARFKSGNSHGFSVFRGIGGRYPGKALLAELRRHMQRRTLAGLCFTYDPVDPELRELLDEFPTFPYILLHPLPGHPRALLALLDTGDCARRAAAHFVDRGRRDIAVVAMGHQPLADDFVRQARERGLRVPDEWVQSVPANYLDATENLVRLLMSLPSGRRPDGLYVVDDNLLTRAQSGLIKSGVKVPEEVLLVGHANFPDPSASVLPMEKIGFDARDVLECVVGQLTQWQERGTRNPTGIKAKQASEV